MGAIRKWLVRNFILETQAKIFNTTLRFLRAGRVLFPLTGIIGMIILTDPLYPKLQWWDYILILILFTGFYFGFSFFKWSYFNLYPVSVNELDDEQRQAHYRARMSGTLTTKYIPLTEEEEQDYTELTKQLKERYKKPFAGFINILPILITTVLVVIWFFFIFPYFNPDYKPPFDGGSRFF